MREKEKNMAKKNYYAVKQGKVPGIYRTWDACKAQVLSLIHISEPTRH